MRRNSSSPPEGASWEASLPCCRSRSRSAVAPSSREMPAVSSFLKSK
ncbi:MAG: hypothetical protein Q8P67_18860 [archaeon]|nr:hypothetical protein [archaeon]